MFLTHPISSFPVSSNSRHIPDLFVNFDQRTWFNVTFGQRIFKKTYSNLTDCYQTIRSCANAAPNITFWTILLQNLFLDSRSSGNLKLTIWLFYSIFFPENTMTNHRWSCAEHRLWGHPCVPHSEARSGRAWSTGLLLDRENPYVCPKIRYVDGCSTHFLSYCDYNT